MKKNLQYTIIILLLMSFLAIFMTACGELSSTNLKTLQDNCIRIHIRANSNSAEDQAVKLKVRDAITSYLETVLGNCRTKKQAVSLIKNNMQKLAEISDSTLKQADFTYKTRIRLTNEYFPERQYDDYVFPAGNYDALIFELGSGKGDNWWCVAFPPLCFVPSASNGEKIVYKSWIKEMLDKLFER